MEIMEIILLIAGGVIFILSFFIPDRKGAEGGLGHSAENEARELLARELESLRGHVDEMVEESTANAVEKAERALERLSNEKIMAVNEYSDTVLTEIHKNHEEAVFLYDMLNNKHTSLKRTVADVNTAVKEAEVALHSIERGMPALAAAGDRTEEDLAWNQPEAPNPEAAAKQEKEAPVGAGQEGWPEGGCQEYNNNEKILRLYKQGKSAVKIAKELELGIGEVRLVIDLFRNQS